jgi:hypothetical protein
MDLSTLPQSILFYVYVIIKLPDDTMDKLLLKDN